MPISLHSVIGTIGVTLIVLAYLLLTLGKLSRKTLAYSVLNALGAILIIVSLRVDFNFAALLIETFWLGISIYGIYKALCDRSTLCVSVNSPAKVDNEKRVNSRR